MMIDDHDDDDHDLPLARNSLVDEGFVMEEGMHSLTFAVRGDVIIGVAEATAAEATAGAVGVLAAMAAGALSSVPHGTR